MILNLNKTKEIVFYRPSAQQSLPSSVTSVTGIEQVGTAKLIGITVVKRHFTTSFTHPNPYPSLSQYIVVYVPNLVRKSFPCAK